MRDVKVKCVRISMSVDYEPKIIVVAAREARDLLLATAAGVLGLVAVQPAHHRSLRLAAGKCLLPPSCVLPTIGPKPLSDRNHGCLDQYKAYELLQTCCQC